MMLRKRLNLIQVLRAVAIIFVMFGHSNTLVYNQYSVDWLGMGSWGRTGGVDLFFVISGFMITYLYTNKIGVANQSVNFLKRRLLKIIPFYWLVTIGAASLFFIFPQLGDASDRSLGKILTSMLFLNSDPTLVVAWSLTHIILFYIMFSIFITAPQIMKYILLSWVFLSILHLLDITPFKQLSSVLFGINNLEIWLGAIAAYIIKSEILKHSYSLVIAGVVIFVLIWTNNTNELIDLGEGTIRAFLYGIGSFLIVLGVANLDIKKEFKVSKTLTLIGNASYCIFLTHGPFLQFYILIFNKLGVFNILGIKLSLIVISLFTVVTGVFIYKLIESPMNKFIFNKMISNHVSRSPNNV